MGFEMRGWNMHRLLLLWSKIQKNRYQLIIIAILAVFAAAMILLFIQINKLNYDLKLYETQVTYLTEQRDEYEAALAQNGELMTKISQLENRTEVLEFKNKTLIDEKDKIADKNSELERLNGELLKKFDGLSKLN